MLVEHPRIQTRILHILHCDYVVNYEVSRILNYALQLLSMFLDINK